MSQSAVPGRDTVYVWFGRTAGDRPEAARRLLRHAGGMLLGRVETEIRVGRDAAGRPFVRAGDAAELPVSVSHAGDAVVVAARRAGPVGVDVETRRELPAVALARRWFAPGEAAWLADRPAERRAEAFLLLWTAKEAVGKALGRGLRDGGLGRLMPRPDGPGGLLRPVPGPGGLRVGHPRLAGDAAGDRVATAAPTGGPTLSDAAAGPSGLALFDTVAGPGGLVLAVAVGGPVDGVEIVTD
ncbi:4'-phosphopantetheinyl transferase family protein [Micromonospora sp. CA-111912]|uniref:4'-phosphopantetheinyl transferase family protein n=1 Tax=Micromonospora sp. CA-111912 TaxID=3239955 RepID=UPI003D913DD0